MEEKLEVLKTAHSYINNLKLGIKDLIDKINFGRENNAMVIIPQIADGFEWLISAIILTEDFHKGSISISNINEKIQEVIEALENEDYILTGDLFNYEVLPELDQIENDIKKIIS